MKKTILSFLICITAILSVHSQSIEFADIPYIEVTGSSEMEVVPDELYFQITVKEYEKDKSTKVSLDEIDVLLKNKLTALGIGIENLQISDITSSYSKKFLQGYEVFASKEYRLKITDFSKADSLYTCLAEKYISYITLLYTANSKITEFRKQVKIDAIKAAKNKAEYLVESIGDTLGRTLLIEEIEPTYSYNYYGNYSNSNSFSNNVTVYNTSDYANSFQTINLRYEIKVRFEIK
jgi:uncharacterized protein YggE